MPMNPIVLYRCSKSTRPYVKLGSNPFSTFLLIIYLTQSSACRFVTTLSWSSSRYSSSEFVSSASRARLIVLTLTDPTFSAVPPIELKSKALYFHIGLDYFLCTLCAYPHFRIRINSIRTSLGENSLYRFSLFFTSLFS